MQRYLGIILCLVVFPLYAQSEPLELVTAMVRAMAELNYQGTLVSFKNAKLDTSKYFHSAQDGVEQERLSALNSPLREVVREGDSTSCLFTSTNEAIVDLRPVGKSFIQDFPKDPAMLQKSYDLIPEAEEQVAMRPTDVLLIKPRDQYRYTRKLWLDKSTHLPLKIEVQDFTGGMLEQVMFTDLDVSHKASKMDLKLEESKVQHINEFEVLGLDTLPITLENLPTGFEKVFFHRTTLRSDKKLVNHLLLSDGLSSVSVYLEDKPKSYHAGLQSAGAVNSLSRIVGDHLIIVIGDVPATMVKFIAQGIAFK